ncbi:arsenate reductase [Sphingomonas sp.]|jgi:arsenate reductase|uniref:arsenate reductase n=1 Tax=Sphingomonas sp. TaxID=28214 RepID=UPI002ED99F22
MTPTIYGIANCDTMKKARAWLADAGIAVAFHDYKKRGIDAATLGGWVDQAGWERLLNRAGTTFRKLPEEAKAGLDRDRAITLMIAHPSAIRRPVLVHGDGIELGFDPARYAALFAR